MRHPRAAVALIVLAALWVAPRPAAAQAIDPYFEFLMARRLEAQGDAAGAVAALERAASMEPKAAAIRAEIAGVQFRRNRRDEAEKAANEALVLDAANPDAHRVLGMLAAARTDTQARGVPPAEIAKNVDDAITHLEKATVGTAAGSDIQLYFQLGRLYLRKGDPEKAITTLGRVVDLNPGSIQARVMLAQAQVNAGRMDAAITTLQEVVDDEPRIASTLGRYLEQAGRPKEAADAFAKALAIAPMDRDLKFRRISALYGSGQLSEALAAATLAQQEHPDDLRFARLRARALFETGAQARAFEVIELVARANPRDVQTLYTLADMYNTAKRPDDAEKTARQILSVEPASANALNYLGYLLADHGRQLDEAVRLVRRALELEPDNPSFQDSLGWAFFRQGNLEQAQRYLAPAAQKLPRNSVIQDHYADVLAKQGRWAEAVAAWTKALEGDADGLDRAAVEKKLQDARGRVR